MKTKNLKTFGMRVLLLAVLIGIAFIPIFFIFKSVDANLWDALCSGNQEKIVEEVQKYDNIWGALIIIILQFVQDLSIVIPSAPIHIAAGMVLGTFGGFIVCHIGDVFYNMLVFLLYSKIKKYVDKVIPIDETSKTVKFLRDGQSPAYMVIMACILPAIPNGFIPYAAANSKMDAKKYFFAILIGPAIPTFVLTLMGDMIFNGNWLLFVFLVAISFIGVFFLVKYQNYVLSLYRKQKAKIYRIKDKMFCKKPIKTENKVKSGSGECMQNAFDTENGDHIQNGADTSSETDMRENFDVENEVCKKSDAYVLTEPEKEV